MKNVRTVVTALAATALLVAGSGLFACKKKEPETIKIGAILPLTGPAAQFGTWMQRGLDIAASDINEKGGVNGKNVEVLFEDSASDPKTGLSAYGKLRTVHDVKFVFSAISGVTLAILPKATEDGVLVLTSSTHPDITNGDYLAIRIYFTPDEEATAMADFAYEELGLRKIGILYLNDESLSGYNEEFVKSFGRLTGETHSESYEFGATDFKTQLLKIKDWGPDGLYVGGWKEVGNIIRQARELGLDVQILGPVTFDSPQTIEIAGEAAEGAIFTIPAFDPKSTRENMVGFRTAYKEAYGEEPEVNVAIYYDGLSILAAAIAKAGDSPVDVKKAIIGETGHEGVMGTISFNADGDIVMPIQFMVVNSGAFKPYGEITGG